MVGEDLWVSEDVSSRKVCLGELKVVVGSGPFRVPEALL